MSIVRLISNCDEKVIHPAELLIPLNEFSNLVNFIENFESKYDEYLLRRRIANNQKPNFLGFVELRLRSSRHRIYSNNDQNAVMIQAISKNSPYWIDLALNVSPFVLAVIKLLIVNHENELKEKLIAVLSNLNWFNSITAEEQLIFVDAIIKSVKVIQAYVVIEFNEDN
jgi:hypothetical protein